MSRTKVRKIVGLATIHCQNKHLLTIEIAWGRREYARSAWRVVGPEKHEVTTFQDPISRVRNGELTPFSANKPKM